MKSLMLTILFPLLFSTTPHWLNDLKQAKQIAQQEHKYILLNFSGSDWCGPCIRMHQEVFNSDEFQKVADKKLVMVNADFPRLKKNQLPVSQQKINDELAEQYNTKGLFPFTLLLDENGKVIKTWEGFYVNGSVEFSQLINQLTISK
ncbi:MAG: thioredoxin family protein [Chitinophagia bacterium]|nr:thioredoxin family protein [Chitinophagia bacterium]